MKARKALPLPPFFDPKNAGKWEYRPNHGDLFLEAQKWRKQHGLISAAADKKKIHMLPIDMQKDFCFPDGTLYVGGRSGTGAIDDSRRLAEFTYRNLDLISYITPTMDTHFAIQIFFRTYWLDQDDQPLQPYDDVTGDLTIMRMGKAVGKAKPNPAAAPAVANGNYGWLLDHAAHYCSTLEKAKKYLLKIWPEHCILGSDGHALVGIIQEMRMFHSYVRHAQSGVEIKGGNPNAECYSVFGAEVRTQADGHPLAQKNVRLIKTLLEADYVIMPGQAASHCVKSSIADFLDEILAKDPKLAEKVYVLEDCMSAVTVPNPAGGFFVDYTPDAEAALARFANAGMHVVKSTTPIEDWPGIQL
jgi:nicotinamidase-related amidase